jgi:hypothetical protein
MDLETILKSPMDVFQYRIGSGDKDRSKQRECRGKRGEVGFGWVSPIGPRGQGTHATNHDDRSEAPDSQIYFSRLPSGVSNLINNPNSLSSLKMKAIIAVPVTLAMVYRALSHKSLTPAGCVAAVLTAIVHAVHPWNLPFALLIVFYLAGSRVTKVCKTFPPIYYSASAKVL